MTQAEGGCHCGAVRFRVNLERFEASECNCSICRKKGFLHVIVPPERFTLLQGAEQLTEYRFHTKTARHTFCKICGIHAFYTPRSDPNQIDVNVRCLDDEELQKRFQVRSFDGNRWEESIEALRSGDTPKRERVRGAFLGLAIGDALGAPFAFQTAAQIAERGRVTELAGGGAWRPGEWTDGTALALAAVESYRNRSFELDLAGRAMLAWLETGPKDIGNLTKLALNMIVSGEATALDAGTRALKIAPGWAANGSLTRAAPTGLIRTARDPRLIEEAVMLSAITHADPRCLGACVALSAAISTLAAGASVFDALSEAETAAQEGGGPQEVVDLLRAVANKGALKYQTEKVGMVLLCLERALVTVRDARSLEDGLIDVVNQGGDTDTNASVAGALLGARFGERAIPARWLDGLRERARIEQAIQVVVAAAEV